MLKLVILLNFLSFLVFKLLQFYFMDFNLFINLSSFLKFFFSLNYQ